jgi:hypothetical protein
MATLARAGGTVGGGGSAQGSAGCVRRRWRRMGATVSAVLVVAALVGCGSTASEVDQAVGDAAQAAHAVTQLSQKAMRSWCPAAVADGGRSLTQAQARACLRRAWNGWLAELKRHGYNPQQVARGK